MTYKLKDKNFHRINVIVCNENGSASHQSAHHSTPFYSHATYVQPGFHFKVHRHPLLIRAKLLKKNKQKTTSFAMSVKLQHRDAGLLLTDA